MTIFLVVVAALIALVFLYAWKTGLFARRRLERQVTIDGLARKFIIWLPPARDERPPLAVVFAFHGAFGSGHGFEQQTTLHTAREAADFVIVYPDGFGRTWNAGDCCGPAMRRGIDELKFVVAMLEDVAAVVPIDRQRIYGTGFSNGGRLCYYLTSLAPDLFAAIAPVGGAVLTNLRPRRPIPVLHMHGTEDTSAPYHGGESTFKNVPVHEPIEQAITFWSRLAQAVEQPRQMIMGGAIERIGYRNDSTGVRVELWRIPALGHHWPGLVMTPEYEAFRRKIALGPLGPAVNVAGDILRFFAGYSSPGGGRPIDLARVSAARAEFAATATVPTATVPTATLPTATLPAGSMPRGRPPGPGAPAQRR